MEYEDVFERRMRRSRRGGAVSLVDGMTISFLAKVLLGWCG